MAILRFILRFVFFMVGLAAILVVVGAGIFMFMENNNAAITIAEGDELIGPAPTDPELLAIYVILQARADEITTPMSDDPTEIPFTVEFGESALGVGQRLQEMGFVSDGELFRQFLRYNQLDASLEAGDYVLRRDMNMREIGQALQEANFDEIELTLVEGWRAEQIAEYLTEEGIMDGQAFLAFARDGTAIDHNITFDKPGGHSYEGYLYPDTYRLPVRAKPEDLIIRMMDNLATRLPANAIELAGQNGLSFYEVLILASIVEREAVVPSERAVIADVYLNRLEEGMFLRADPTVQYAMGYQPAADQWWKTPVTLEEYEAVDSLYNTYLYPGMPPGPIANPGIESIIAVLQPADTPYLFFVACGGDGAHIFAETFEEHDANVARCQGG